MCEDKHPRQTKEMLEHALREFIEDCQAHEMKLRGDKKDWIRRWEQLTGKNWDEERKKRS